MCIRDREGISYYMLREISALKKLKHKNIVSLKEVIHHRSMIYMVMEYAEADLSYFISKFGGNQISIFQIQNIMGQLLTGLAYTHSNNICHRDLKPENILISPEGFIKISDFGLARYMNPLARQNYTTEVVTQVYRAPELLMNIESYDFAVDIWSIGCIFAELILQFPLFVAETPMKTLQLIFSIMGKPDENQWPELSDNLIFQQFKEIEKFSLSKCKYQFPPMENILGVEGIDLLYQMLRVNPVQRITAQQALEHPFFSSWM
eukprot:TRINITY_DN11059_c0_g2_i2.p1 TRINITY_DN11059_c0_g2~~TRINITY_DN11059_c0_g2_i2.p1  ORF type:complete len:305 (-),score=19.70 TRINITY_DN11059_c0_g2_i2:224-1012(-)